MKPGDTFIASEHPRILAHLWLILSDPRQDPTHVVLVNLTNTRRIQESLSVGLIRSEAPFLPEVLERIRSGALLSRRTPRKVIEILNRQGR